MKNEIRLFAWGAQCSLLRLRLGDTVKSANLLSLDAKLIFLFVLVSQISLISFDNFLTSQQVTVAMRSKHEWKKIMFVSCKLTVIFYCHIFPAISIWLLNDTICIWNWKKTRPEKSEHWTNKLNLEQTCVWVMQKSRLITAIQLRHDHEALREWRSR